MPDINIEIIFHELNIDSTVKDITQKRTPMVEEKSIATRKELGKLVTANFVREIRLLTRVCNLVMINNSNGK